MYRKNSNCIYIDKNKERVFNLQIIQGSAWGLLGEMEKKYCYSFNVQ